MRLQRFRRATPEQRAAIFRAALIELVVFALGMFLYFQLGSIWALIVPVIIGSGIFLFLVAQAGLFESGDDGR